LLEERKRNPPFRAINSWITGAMLASNRSFFARSLALAPP
jgi:hypothetical protein